MAAGLQTYLGGAKFYSLVYINNYQYITTNMFQFFLLIHLPLSAAYICQWTGSSLVQVMACPLSAPGHYLNQCWLFVNWTPRNIFSEIWIWILSFLFKKMQLKMLPASMSPILSRGRWVKYVLIILIISISPNEALDIFIPIEYDYSNKIRSISLWSVNHNPWSHSKLTQQRMKCIEIWNQGTIQATREMWLMTMTFEILFKPQSHVCQHCSCWWHHAISSVHAD